MAMTVLNPGAQSHAVGMIDTYSPDDEREMVREFRDFSRANREDADMEPDLAALDRDTMGKGWYRGALTGLPDNVFEADSYDHAVTKYLSLAGVIRTEGADAPRIEFLGEDKPGVKLTRVCTDAEIQRMEQEILQKQIELGRAKREKKNAEMAAQAMSANNRKNGSSVDPRDALIAELQAKVDALQMGGGSPAKTPAGTTPTAAPSPSTV